MWRLGTYSAGTARRRTPVNVLIPPFLNLSLTRSGRGQGGLAPVRPEPVLSLPRKPFLALTSRRPFEGVSASGGALCVLAASARTQPTGTEISDTLGYAWGQLSGFRPWHRPRTRTADTLYIRHRVPRCNTYRRHISGSSLAAILRLYHWARYPPFVRFDSSCYYPLLFGKDT